MIFDTKAAKFTLKNVFFLSLLIAAGAILIFSLVPGDCWFGSKTDWYSQHVTIADYMRKNFYATASYFLILQDLEAALISIPCPITDSCVRMYCYLIAFPIFR